MTIGLLDRLRGDPYAGGWPARRQRFLKRHGRVCARCHDRTPRECHVHHLRYPPWSLRYVWPLWLVPDWWLMPLCEDCHVLVPRRPSRLGLTHRQVTRRIFTAGDWYRWHARLAFGLLRSPAVLSVLAAVLAALTLWRI